MLTSYRVVGRITHSELDTITYLKYRRPERILSRAMTYLTHVLVNQEMRGGGEGGCGLLDWKVARAHVDAMHLLQSKLELVMTEVRARLGDE